MSFADVQSLKELDGSFTNVKDDKELQAVVNGVNQKVIEFLDREPLVKSNTDIFDIYPTSSLVYLLRGYPVSSLTSVTLDDVELTSDQYRLNSRSGRLELVDVVIPKGLAILTVIYEGGMSDTVENLRTAFPSIAYEANMQCLFEFRRKQHLAHKIVSIKDGGSETLLPREFTKETKRVLRKYRRFQAFA
jgi:hypothetical protein